MERRSWLWRRKSSEKSPGETESSGSMSSHSERYSDEQESLRVSPNHSTQSPEVTSKASVTNEEVTDNVRSLREKLSAALINISAKEDLVKQHAKVAEEAVTGWEKAENESAVLKQQLEAAAQKKSTLEDRLGHVDGALKECLRKLRQAREEQQQKIHEAVVKKTHEFELTKFELDTQLVELQAQLEAAKGGDATTVNSDILLKLEAAEKQNLALNRELLARVEELELRTLERDLSTETAETASKQHLESIKKVAKLEAECRKLRAITRKTSLVNDHKSITASSVYIESLTDSQSDSGERLLALETDGCEPSCSDSWASALIAELGQFKNEKAIITRNLTTTSSMEIDLMDDFLEMERLAASSHSEIERHGTEPGVSSRGHDVEDCQHRADLDAMTERTAELEKQLVKVEAEKEGLEVALEESEGQLREAEEKLVELHRQLDFTIDSNQATEAQLRAMDAEVQKLHAKVASLEREVEEERGKCRKLEDELSKKRRETVIRQTASSNGETKIKQEKEMAVAAGKLAECQMTIASLGRQLKSLATLEDFLVDSEHPLELNGGPRKHELWKSPSSSETVPKTSTNPFTTSPVDGSSPSSKSEASPQSSSSSSTSTSSLNHAVTSDKNRNGFGKLFSRSKSAMRLENQ